MDDSSLWEQLEAWEDRYCSTMKLDYDWTAIVPKGFVFPTAEENQDDEGDQDAKKGASGEKGQDGDKAESESREVENEQG